MVLKRLHILLIIIAAIALFTSCKKVVVTVNSIPENTPVNQSLYIVGNFNNWDPGDERYQLTLNPDSTFSISLPPGFGTVEYKFTRGDWTTVEKDICGYEIDNRRALIGESDTVYNAIESWNDLDPLNCPRMTLLVKGLPENTPKEDVIAIAGNFNDWSVDSSAVLSSDSSGNYSITIDRPPDIEEIEFKLTRGDLASAEGDVFGNMTPNRVLRFGVRDTVEINVEGWVDRPDKRGNRVVVILKSLPVNTPKGSEFYLASSINGWNPGDKNYQFQVNSRGELFYPLPRKQKPLEFKITRGNWGTVEVDRYGYDISNRQLDLTKEDTVYLDVMAWKDISFEHDKEVTIIIDDLPETTPENASFYLTGNFNGWRPGRSKYRFESTGSGEYILNISRGKGMLECKVTRGSWETVEIDPYGNAGANRSYWYGDIDTLYLGIDNWRDKPLRKVDSVTLVLSKIPENTPQRDNLYLASEINNWDPGNPRFVFYYLSDGRPYITIPARGNLLEYKITRGNWGTVEVNKDGYSINNRELYFGFADTVYVDVASWRDFGGKY